MCKGEGSIGSGGRDAERVEEAVGKRDELERRLPEKTERMKSLASQLQLLEGARSEVGDELNDD